MNQEHGQGADGRQSGTEAWSAIALAAGAMIWTWAVLLALLPSVGFPLGVTLGGWVPVAALVGPLALGLAFAGTDGRWRMPAALAVFAGALIGSVALASWCYDTSYDGQWYHQEAVLRLAEGWNPLRDGNLWSGSREDLTLLWVDHYPQASWLAGAGLLRLLGTIEAGKAIALLLVAGTFLTSIAAFLRLGLGAARSGLVALVLAANPVSSYQALTFYVDGQLASALGTIVAAGMAFALGGDRRFLVPLAAAAAWGANLKFTGPLFVAIAAVALLVAVRRLRRSSLRDAAVATAAGAVVALVIGIHPYLTNLAREGHPLHPLMGSRKLDIITTIAPRGFTGRPALARFALSTFGASDNDVGREPRLKVPFTLNKTELRAFTYSDPRYAGFGPWFGGALLLALAGALALQRAGARRWLVVAAVILASVLFFPEAWWARYVPQFWLVPVLVCAGLLAQRGRLSALGFVLGGVLAVNAALVGQANVSAQRKWTRQIDAALVRMAGANAEGPIQVAFGPHAALRRRLDEAGIRYVRAEALACETPLPLVRSELRWCER